MHNKRTRQNNLKTLDFSKFINYIVGVINKEYDMDNEKTQSLIKMLEEQKEELQKKIKSINTTIEIMKQTQILEESTRKKEQSNKIDLFEMKKDDGYNKKMSMGNKIRFFLKKEKRFLHNKQIAEFIVERENHLNPKKLSGQLSANFSNLKIDGVLISVQVGKSLRNNFWGSKNWVDSDGKIKPGYEYDEEYLYDAVHEEIKL